MKGEMSAFDILAMTSEMQVLVGGYLDKIFHWDSRNVMLRINTPSDGRKELVLHDLRWLYMSPERPDIPDIPSQFAVHLRKVLTNGRITSVYQKEFDRVIILEVQKGPVSFQIVIELFGGGNLIVISEGKIVGSVVSRRWRHREIRPGADYTFPQARFDPTSMDDSSFYQAVRGSNSDAVRTLATAINTGGQTAEEVCKRAEVDKSTNAKELTDDDIRRLYDSLTLMIEEAVNNRRPREVLKDGRSIDVTPIPLELYASEETRDYQTFSDAIYAYVSSFEPPEKEDPELARLQRQLERQRKAIEAQDAEAHSFVEKAEAIYSDYLGTEALLRAASKLRGMKWDDAQIEGEKISGVTSVNPKNHTLSATISGKEVELDYTLSVEGNANQLYKLSKEFRDKMEGAKKALKDTEERLARRIKEGEKQRLVEKHVARKTKEFWFERYKWFFTSGDKLVMSGRDARSNDQLIKRHLKPADRYVHADLHGAPSAIIKEGENATERELEEACTFALAHSKAWTAGASEGAAYWVLPDQVSKMAQAGEFVPRGAFIIRGRRNYLYHLRLELVVGEVDYQGSKKIMCAPPSAIIDRSSKYVVIRPGKSNRGKISSKLARAFEVPEEEISRILPPGNMEIIERVGLE
ncbi:MAG: fibronectin-binding domain-containing protein [Euryarchaeota archaeon]|nr:fibronectin-binding domain-containing protein [Euryarchaeota archaeon]